MLKGQRYTLVMMDFQISVVDGLEATNRFRSQETTSHLPVIAMAAHVLQDDQDRCAVAGMDDYISKPILPFGPESGPGEMVAE